MRMKADSADIYLSLPSSLSPPLNIAGNIHTYVWANCFIFLPPFGKNDGLLEAEVDSTKTRVRCKKDGECLYIICAHVQ